MDVFPSGKLDGTVEADETYIEGKKRGMGRRYTGNKTAADKVAGGVVGRRFLAEPDFKHDTRAETDGARAATGVPKVAGPRSRAD